MNERIEHDAVTSADGSLGKDELILLLALLVGWIVAEFLIFGFEQEAREDWVRMLPAAILGAPMFSVALSALALGLLLLYGVWRDIKQGFKDWHPFILVPLYLGVRVPHYWIKRIVIDDVPAFGANPDNVYAVAGLNTMALMVLWTLQSAAAGLVIHGLVWLYHRLRRRKA